MTPNRSPNFDPDFMRKSTMRMTNSIEEINTLINYRKELLKQAGLMQNHGKTFKKFIEEAARIDSFVNSVLSAWKIEDIGKIIP